MNDIEMLRKKISIANDDSVIGDEFSELINHPMLTWNDLIGFLRFKLIIGEFAAFRLHEYLNVTIPPEGPIRAPDEWFIILNKKQIEPSSLVHI